MPQSGTHRQSANYVLVTGGAGYVGSHACKSLAAAGYVPVTLDNLSRGHASAVKWGPLVVGDIGDRRVLDTTLERYRPDVVLHFAAYAYVGESVERPGMYYRNNFANTLSLLDSMVEHQVLRLVMSSTCATYGIPRDTPIRESDPQEPINPYGMSKFMVERVLRDYDIACGLRFVALRYFNAAGSDPQGDIGWRHEPEMRLIPRALMAARGELAALTIFGDDFSTNDGTCIRDYVHVSDLADAHVSALRYLCNVGGSLALNLGTGDGFSVREVIHAVERTTGRTVPTETLRRRSGDPPILVADPSLARKVLSFRPTRSSLEYIVHTAWHWLNRRGSIAEMALRQ